MLMILWPPICFSNPPIKICREKHGLNSDEAKKKEAKRLKRGKRKRVDTKEGDEELAEADAIAFPDTWECEPMSNPVYFGMV